MSSRTYNDGVLVEEWDDALRIYRRWDASGAIVESRAYTTAEIAKIKTLGRVTVNDSDVLMYDDDGSVMFRLGPQTNGDRGFTLSRQDGSVALSVAKSFPASMQQEIRLFDRFGYKILEEEALGTGLSFPILPIPMQPVQATASTLQCGPNGWEVPLNSSTYTTVFQATYPRHNQFSTFKAMIAASDTTTAAELRIIDVTSGTQLGQFLAAGFTATRATGTTAFVETVLPSINMPGTPYQTVTIGLQVRRSAGAGTLRVALVQ